MTTTELTVSRKGGTEHVPISEVQIPDLWEIAHLPELIGYSMGGKSAKDMILECWHLCHDLRNELLERGAK